MQNNTPSFFREAWREIWSMRYIFIYALIVSWLLNGRNHFLRSAALLAGTFAICGPAMVYGERYRQRREPATLASLLVLLLVLAWAFGVMMVFAYVGNKYVWVD